MSKIFKPAKWRCRSCGEIVFSKYPGHFASCGCGAIAVDYTEYYGRHIGDPVFFELVEEESYEDKVNRFINKVEPCQGHAMAQEKEEQRVQVWQEVIKDMSVRNEDGAKKYNRYLMSDCPDDMLSHLYNELLDAVVYTRTLLLQREKETNKKYDGKL